MKPDTPAPNRKIESFEVVPAKPSFDYVSKAREFERIGSVGSEALFGSDSATPNTDNPVALSLPSLATSAPVTASVATPTADDNASLTASDGDLIEKEWVEKAKQIVNQTADDPYQREDSVSKLRIDYLKKRFGRELGATDKK